MTLSNKSPFDLNTFCQKFPLKAVGIYQRSLVFFNCYDLKTFRITIPTFTFKAIFKFMNPCHFMQEQFREHKVKPDTYLAWLYDMAVSRSKVYPFAFSHYVDVPSNLKDLFSSPFERRLLAESFCLLIEKRMYQKEYIPLFTDHPIELLNYLSPELEIEHNQIKVPSFVELLQPYIN